jgi:glycosyltransferase involved in cell wall biosynthesis
MVLERGNTQGHVLIISHDVVGERMAGPGIRYYHLARVLAREFKVVLAVPAESTPTPSRDFSVIRYRAEDKTSLEGSILKARTVLVPAVWLAKVPALLQSPVPLVIDGYDPCMAESLSLRVGEPNGLQRALTQAYLAGDFFICASERQRDWWLGLLEATGRVNIYTFQEDPSLRCLVDTVPFGLPETSPQHTRQVVKGIWPGIGEEDRVILWGGGLWSWLDPLTAVHAMARVWQHRQDVRLIFPGTRHPNPGMAEMPTHNQAVFQTAQELGLLGQAIFFEEWVPYIDWPDVLLESDVALTLHHDTLETRLAFRSRVLDYIWAGLPVVATRGDATSELITHYELGIVVDYGDVDGVSEAILHLLETPREVFSERFERARLKLTWEQAAQPLAEFCRHPRRAPDKGTSCLDHPYCREKLVHQEAEMARLETLVEGYERGKFIQFMDWVHRVKRRTTRVGN